MNVSSEGVGDLWFRQEVAFENAKEHLSDLAQLEMVIGQQVQEKAERINETISTDSFML